MPHQYIDSDAVFSEDGTYRYLLWRKWGSGNSMMFIGLNPSTADAEHDDPTVSRMVERAKRLGFGGLVVANVFALRGTDPSVLRGHPDPIGPANDMFLASAAISTSRYSGIVICGWGKHAELHGRGAWLRNFFKKETIPLHYLKLNADGSPSHPLYLSYDLQPQLWV